MNRLLFFCFFALGCLFAQPKIGLLLSDTIISRWNIEKEIIREEALAHGYRLVVKSNLFSSELQVRQGLDLLEDKEVKALIVVAEDKDKMSDLVRRAGELKKPIVAYDRRIPNQGCIGFVGFNPVDIGKKMAEYVQTKKEIKKVLMVTGPKKDTNSVLIAKGVSDYFNKLTPSTQVEVVFLEEWSALASFSVCSDYFSAGKEVDAIICGNDYLASGAIDAMHLFGYDDILVAGQDADPIAIQQIKQGNQVVTVFKPHASISKAAVKLVLKLLGKQINNGTCEYEELILPFVVVDSSNIDNFKTTDK